MSDAADAAQVLAGFQPISDDDPRVREFAQSVVEAVAARPSPAPPEDRISRVEAKLDEILILLRGGTPQ